MTGGVLAVFLGALGAAMASFGAAAGERLLRGEGIAGTRSCCRSCGRVLRARDLVPLLSYPLLRGRCAACGARIPAILWHAEICGAGLGGAAALVAPDPARALLWACWGWALLALALTDLRRFRLPDALMAVAAGLGLAMAVAGDGSGWPDLPMRLTEAAIGALSGGGTFALVRAAYRWRTGRDGMGMGDVILAAVLGLGLGLERLPMTILLAAVAALAMAMLRAWCKGRGLRRLGRVPFGAAMAIAGAVMALV